jgi:carbon-monoxide dehydrogenase large subunit
MTETEATTGRGIGASLLRKEDERHLFGRGEFVPDIRLPGIQEVAFLRSPHAHARIRSITVPAKARGRVYTAADLPRLQPIRVVTQAAGAKSPPWPPLATDKVRYVGEAIAACIAPTRGEAEDLANSVAVEYEVLEAAVDAPQVWRGSRHLVHESWGDNLYLERTIEGGDIEAAARAAEVTVTREYRMNRQSGAPLEGRAVLAYRDYRLGETLRPKRRIRSASRSVRSSISSSAGFASSHPMSAAGSARRRGSTRRRSCWRHWRSNAITRCAGSRTAPSTC